MMVTILAQNTMKRKSSKYILSMISQTSPSSTTPPDYELSKGREQFFPCYVSYPVYLEII